MFIEKNIDLFSFHKMFKENVLLTYKGPFHEQILSVFGSYIEATIKNHPTVSRKLFSIFIELAQNIAYYSAEKNKQADNKIWGIGTLVIVEAENHYSFMTGNIIEQKNLDPIIEKCQTINQLDRNELRKFKREQRNLPPGEKGNAHIGLIQVALTSANPLEFEVTKVDDGFSYFSLKIKVDK